MTRAASPLEAQPAGTAATDVNIIQEVYVDLNKPDFKAFWTAAVWRFRHSNPAKQVLSINWRFALPGGKLSTDQEFYILLESFRTVVWGMLTNDAWGKKLSVGTLAAMSGGIREAFRWFAWQGVRDFSQVSQVLQQRYLDVLPKLILTREEVYPNFLAEGYDFGYHSPSLRSSIGEDEEEDEDLPLNADSEDDGFSYSQVANRVSVLHYVYAQGALLKKRNLPALPCQPFRGKTLGEVSSGLAQHVINRIPALPQAVSLPMLEEVFRWIDDVGPRVSNAHKCFHSVRSEGRQKLIDAFAQMDAAGFSEKRMALLPWRERNEGQTEGAEDPLAFGYHRMRLAVLMVRDACGLALQYLAGLRISEVCSPVVHKDKINGLPSCVYKRQSPDGMMDLYFMKGLLLKGRHAPKANDWVIGCVPRGSSHLPVLVRALNLLHDVLIPLFGVRKELPLFPHFHNRWGMPSSEESVHQADGTDLQRGFRRFIRCFVDLSQLPDFDRFGNSLVRYRESKGQCIRTHQGRKTFAEFCLQTRKSSLSALSLHYGHLTESITYKGYFQAVQRLNDDIETFGHSATVDFFVSRSERRVVFGAMAELVNNFLDEFGLRGVDDLTKLRDMVSDIVITHSIRIYFSDHGNCFISLAPHKSRCQAAAGGVSWMFNRPNEKARTVSMCGGCDCLGLDRSHITFYERRAQSWAEAAKDPTNWVAVKSYEQSKKIVRILKENTDVAHKTY